MGMRNNWGMGNEELTGYIAIESNIRFGKPCIKGARIAVGDIFQWLSAGMTNQEITRDFPELEEVHIRAALAFAAARDAMTEMAVYEAAS